MVGILYSILIVMANTNEFQEYNEREGYFPNAALQCFISYAVNLIDSIDGKVDHILNDGLDGISDTGYPRQAAQTRPEKRKTKFILWFILSTKSTGIIYCENQWKLGM